MNVYLNRPRRGGKTHEIVKLFRADPRGYFVVHSAPSRRELIDAYKLSPDEQHRVIIADSGTLAGTDGKIYVDNMEMVLAVFLGRFIDVATITAESL